MVRTGSRPLDWWCYHWRIRRSRRWHFADLFSYNEYLVAAVMLRHEELFTVPIGIQRFMQRYSTD